MKNQMILLMMMMMMMMSITDVKLELQNTKYTESNWHVLSSHFQITQADDLN